VRGCLLIPSFMFLFLSKLLPIFLYPVGLSCVLLTIAIVLLWRKRSPWGALSASRLALIPVTLTLILLFVTSSTTLSDWIVKSLEFQTISQGTLPKADAIVVLGGATESAIPPRPWIELREEGDRVLYGGKLYRDGKAPRIILSGGRVDWRPSSASEADDMAMILDPDSLNTRENAVNTKKIMEAQGIRQILLVTSAMHMPRSLLIFKKLGINAIPAPTDYTVLQLDQAAQGTTAALILDSLPDADQLRRTSRALKEYVGIFVYWLRGWI
jgi:uncharacterized SAM-binding protein YcdF (DUF218 family)